MNTSRHTIGQNRVRGKKRIELIKNFLNGNEDPDYEVIPTNTSGRFIVKHRQVNVNEPSNEPSNVNMSGTNEPSNVNMSNFNESPNKPQGATYPYGPKEPQNTTYPYGSKEPQGTTCPYDPTISYQILEQLKLLGEEQMKKRSKKEQKKFVKRQIKKHLNKSSKHITNNEYDDGYAVEYDEYADEYGDGYAVDKYETDTPHRSNISQTQYTPNYFVPNRRRVNLLK